MNKNDWLAEQFEGYRAHLTAVAYRMLGSLPEADDAVQASWLRLSRADTTEIENMGGWLTTVVARVCLDMMRSRNSRREDPLEEELPEPAAAHEYSVNPEQEALLADSVGVALLVVLSALEPAERLAFVLHDLFAMPFEEIAPIVGRSSTAARQLASRARRRVRGAPAVTTADFNQQREVVNAFLAATRKGDFDALLAVLDPEAVSTADEALVAIGGTAKTSGGRAVARAFARRGGARFTQPILINGAPGIVVAPQGKLLLLLKLSFKDGKISGLEGIADPAHISQLDISVWGD